MKIQTTDQNKRQKSSEFFKKLYKLTIAEGIVFWVTSIVTSLLPIATKYRAANSNWSIQTVWFGSLLAGVIFGFCVSYILLRFFLKIPTKSPIPKSLLLNSIILVIAVILIDVPMISPGKEDSFYYLFIVVMFIAARFLFLGLPVGYFYKKLDN
ncbi:MAG: hypothetical protein WBI17_01920 [Clostridiaceae bacterium]